MIARCRWYFAEFDSLAIQSVPVGCSASQIKSHFLRPANADHVERAMDCEQAVLFVW